MSSDITAEATRLRNSVYTQLPIDVAKRLDNAIGQLVEEHKMMSKSLERMATEPQASSRHYIKIANHTLNLLK